MWQRIKNIYHLGNAILANVWFGFPSRKLTVIGVTGTDGKTTTTSLIYHILHFAGYNASMISSVGAIIGGKEYDVGFHVTTPSPWALQGFIKDALGSPRPLNDSSRPSGNTRIVNKNSSSSPAVWQSNHDYKETVKSSFRGETRPSLSTPRFLVLETTSHAIDQNRIWGIPFDIGVLTNVTHEHLDYHKTYENYVKTKVKLLQMARVAVVNRDDESFKLISNFSPRGEAGKFLISKLVTFGMTKKADVNLEKFPFKTNLIGEFNKYNVLAAISACRDLGITDQIIREAILTFKPPIGREEIVYKNPFTIMVDFAHTPNAFEEILSSIKPSIKGRLIHAFGAAGLRDASKRALMGKASAKYSDIIILTAEDPRTESVEKIMKEIESGITNSKFEIRNPKQIQITEIQNKKKYVLEIPDRQEAITAAIWIAKKGDFVLITGKSHEKSMNYGKGEEPWDEFGAVSQALSVRRDDK